MEKMSEIGRYNNAVLDFGTDLQPEEWEVNALLEHVSELSGKEHSPTVYLNIQLGEIASFLEKTFKGQEVPTEDDIALFKRLSHMIRGLQEALRKDKQAMEGKMLGKDETKPRIWPHATPVYIHLARIGIAMTTGLMTKKQEATESR